MSVPDCLVLECPTPLLLRRVVGTNMSEDSESTSAASERIEELVRNELVMPGDNVSPGDDTVGDPSRACAGGGDNIEGPGLCIY